MTDTFKRDVVEGLSSEPKMLSSKYFYDEKGDALFQQIMAMPEYYLTNAETEIFELQKRDIVRGLEVKKDEYFEIVELGAGDGTKTILLLDYLLAEGYDFKYVPIDISDNALAQLEQSLLNRLPRLRVAPRQGEYFEVISSMHNSNYPIHVFFLGSNLGNLLDEAASVFMQNLSDVLKEGDSLLLGLDLIKSKDIVLPAYDDAQGITKAFNLNLLERMNRELEADFDLSAFEHCPDYNEQTGLTKSFLKSRKNQTVYIKSADRSFDFNEGEYIQTEVSRKYNDAILNNIIQRTSFEVNQKYMDSRQYFADFLLKIRS